MEKKKPTDRLLCEDSEFMWKLSDFFSIFGDATRMHIIALLRREPLNVGAIAAHLGMSDSAVSHQLRILSGHNLVRKERQGKFIFYRLSDEHVEEIFDLGVTHIQEAGSFQ